MFKRFLNWWLCLGEPKVLHKTKIEFFKKAKEAKIKHASVLWSLVKVLYPTGLTTINLDEIIADCAKENTMKALA